ncbi:hypothetical protein C8F01DRAFT_1258305 [Mycena amicta]|nr:hypothetical protein C8F01DRAFT_1258305 [Mycena amicta]
MACITCRKRHIKCVPANKYTERRSCVNCIRKKIVCEYLEFAPSPPPRPLAAPTIFRDFQPTARDSRRRRDSRTSSSSSPPPVRLRVGDSRGFEPYHLQRGHHIHASPKLKWFAEQPVGDPSPFCLPSPSDSASTIPCISRTNIFSSSSSFDSSCYSEMSMYTYLGLHGYVRVPQPRKTLPSPSLLGWDSDVALVYTTDSDSGRVDRGSGYLNAW